MEQGKVSLLFIDYNVQKSGLSLTLTPLSRLPSILDSVLTPHPSHLPFPATEKLGLKVCSTEYAIVSYGKVTL